MPMENDWESMIGRRVRRNRKALGWTQEQLGERLGMHQTSVAKLEAAARPIRVNELAELAVIFDLSPEDLLRPDTDVAEVADAEQAYTDARYRVLLAQRDNNAAREDFFAAQKHLKKVQSDYEVLKRQLAEAGAHLEEVKHVQH
jgi:transcriptional regulator with XRE-family HTH domain